MPKNSFWYPEVEFVLELHKLVANEGLRDIAGLEYICYQVQSKQHKDVWDKAAFLLHSIATTHPFFNGNKRTALITTLFFLSLNRYTGNLTNTTEIKWVPDYSVEEVIKHYNDEETMNFILEVAKYEKTINEVKIFLERKFKS